MTPNLVWIDQSQGTSEHAAHIRAQVARDWRRRQREERSAAGIEQRSCAVCTALIFEQLLEKVAKFSLASQIPALKEMDISSRSLSPIKIMDMRLEKAHTRLSQVIRHPKTRNWRA